MPWKPTPEQLERARESIAQEQAELKRQAGKWKRRKYVERMEREARIKSKAAKRRKAKRKHRRARRLDGGEDVDALTREFIALVRAF